MTGTSRPRISSGTSTTIPNLIIVGSVGIDGTISDFSNTPGNACLRSGNACRERLMNRFMVAPGELILLPDGQGGFVRRSGTSFAAPIVSGAIALLHDRWPWLAQHPREIDRHHLPVRAGPGAPGVDPVYGHGLLDIAASQSPLNYNNLQFYEVRNGVITPRTAAELRATGVSTTFETDGVYFNLYEPIGDTFRDFSIPMSSLLTGKVRTSTGALEYFQRFAQRGLTDWINGGSAGFTDMRDDRHAERRRPAAQRRRRQSAGAWPPASRSDQRAYRAADQRRRQRPRFHRRLRQRRVVAERPARTCAFVRS